MIDPEILVFDDQKTLATHAAEEVIDLLGRAQDERGVATWVLAGGSTPKALYEEVAARSDLLDWPRIHIYFGDERAVPPDHADSNFAMARQALLDHIPAAQVHRIRGELPASLAAEQYAEELAEQGLDNSSGFDVVILGMGTDGHTASLFPNGPELDAETLVTASRSPIPPTDRVTLTRRAFANAREILFLVTGSDKAPTVARILERREPLPARLVSDGAKSVQWLLDRKSARLLENERD